jgi:Holliday junction resolvasome RuvABC endonuclease subunit
MVKAKSLELETKYLVINSNKIVESAVKQDFQHVKVYKALGGSRATVYLGIDPGLTQLTAALIAKTAKGRRTVSFLCATTKAIKGDKSWKTRYTRVEYLAAEVGNMIAWIADTGPKKLWIAIEGYSTQSKGSAVQSMAEIKQAVLYKIFHNNPNQFKNVFILQPTSWKACLIEKGGKLDKEGVQVVVCNRRPMMRTLLGIEGDHNYFDSYAMASVLEDVNNGVHSAALDRFRDREKLK